MEGTRHQGDVMCEVSELLIFVVSEEMVSHHNVNGRSDRQTKIDYKSSPPGSEGELIIDTVEIEP